MQRRDLVKRSAAMGLSIVGVRVMAAPSSVRIGLTAVILADQAGFLARWSEYLAQRIGVPVVFVARESYQTILDLLFSGQIDAAWICGFPYVRRQAQLKLLAAPLYHERPLYQSYLIRNIDGPVALNGWTDLKHRVLAYSDPLSNSGWLVAQGQLRAAGLGEPDLKRAFFAHSHRNVAEAVATELAHAGCIDGYVWETMQLQNMGSVEKTQVIWKSPHYAFPPIVIRQGDRSKALGDLGRTLLDMQDDPMGQELLRALNLNGFAVPDPALFDSIRALAASVHAERS